MRTRTRRQWGWPAAGVLAIIVGAPSLAQAQQSGLFPLAPIRRERVPCPMEDPVYKLYRHEYFGYHPTCWRRFPDGWGCPSPEAPNAAAEFQKLPRDKPPTDLPPEGEGPEPGPAAPGARPDAGAPGGVPAPNPNALPPLPSGERSPFEIDTKPANPPADNPPAGRRSPFETEPKPDAAPTVPPANNPTAPAPRVDAAPAPAADAAVDQPLLALPDPTVGPSSAISSTPPPLATDNRGAPAAPAHAPRRSGLLSRFFTGSMLRR